VRHGIVVTASCAYGVGCSTCIVTPCRAETVEEAAKVATKESFNIKRSRIFAKSSDEACKAVLRCVEAA
jgi:hypothetical protein